MHMFILEVVKCKYCIKKMSIGIKGLSSFCVLLFFQMYL
jgi:hypothetical protein